MLLRRFLMRNKKCSSELVTMREWFVDYKITFKNDPYLTVENILNDVECALNDPETALNDHREFLLEMYRSSGSIKRIH
jgi:hypothetical protein